MLSSACPVIVVLPLGSARSGRGVAAAVCVPELLPSDAQWSPAGSAQCGPGVAAAVTDTALSSAVGRFPPSPDTLTSLSTNDDIDTDGGIDVAAE